MCLMPCTLSLFFYRSAVTHLLCGIYALVIIVLGIVLPASNAITHLPGDHVYYVEVCNMNSDSNKC